MDQQRWDRLQDIFSRVVDLRPEEREAAIDQCCEGDGEMLALVVRLVQEDGRERSLLDAGVAPAAYSIFSEGAPRDRFGPYEVIRQIGEGGMGVVYLAERADLGQRVAIKVLGDAWVSPARRDRFTVEQQLLARLTHPSIAQLFDADTLPDGTPYFVMEYVEGEHLTAYCAARSSTVDSRLRLFVMCCEAVAHAHQHLIVHRDLKPSNILVTASRRVKLLDFGIAKQLESLELPAEQTQALRLLTPQYAAPEQQSGGPVGVFTDVYSLGVILYELLAGRLPFESADAQGEVALRRVPPLVSLAARSAGRGSAATRSQWADLDVICATAVHSDRTRRYASVEALLRDCTSYLRGEPIAARAESVGYRAGKFIRRHAAAVAAVAATLLLATFLTVIYTLRLNAARNEAIAEAAIRERVQSFMLRLFHGDEQNAAPASALRVVDLVDRGVQELGALDQDPRVQAELYLTLGQVYQRLGNLPQASVLMQQSLDRRRAGNASTAETMNSLASLGLLRLAQGQPEEAERLVSEGRELGRRELPDSDPRVARATVALGKVLDSRDARARAIPLLEEAVRVFDQPGPPTQDLSAALTTLANAHYNAGHLDDAEQLNRRVLEIDRQLHGAAHPSVADCLINLAAIAYDRGNYVEAERLRRQALDLMTSWYGPSHPETASAQMILAQALTIQERLDAALPLLEQALATHERNYGVIHPRVALVLNEIAIVHTRREQYDAAEKTFARSIATYRQIYPEGHSRIAIIEANLATVLLNRRQFARAEAGFRGALREMNRFFPDDHLNIGIAQIKLGRALVGLRRFREAEAPTVSGYAILAKKSSPSVSWLQAARLSLAAIYDASGDAAKAKTYRDEHAAVARGASESSASANSAAR